MVEIKQEAAAKVLFELLNFSGRKILEQQLKTDLGKFDAHSLSKGIYWYQVSDVSGMLQRRKLIVQ
jgi:hypothetical protein